VNSKQPASSFSYGRIIVVLWFGVALYLPGAATLFEIFGIENKWYLWNIFYSLYAELVVSVVVFVIVVVWKIRWADEIIGKDFSVREITPAIKLTIFLIIFSIAASYAVFIPLSYVVPDFVQWWFLDSAPIIYYDSDAFPIIPNVLSFLSVVVITPILEEITFRGLLLRRWTKKWNMSKAILFSSILFGVLHADPIGSFAFGVGMCVIYLKTQSLYVPIFCHAANNLVAWLVGAGYILKDGPTHQYTIDALRNEWYIGLICSVIVVIWTIKYLKTPIKSYEWKLPSA